MNISFPYNQISLNKKQYKIVTSDNIELNQLILSCAGSGKTLTVTARLCYMIYKLNCNPSNFLLCTFNRNAAAEMNQRICKFIGISDIYCGTFHSIGIRLLKKYDYLFLDGDYHVDETQLIFLKFLKSERSNILEGKIKYLFVDEFQDINDVQLQIILELDKIVDYIFLVGDDLQNIYSFRGSNNSIILNIKEYFPDIKIDTMNINYRSSPEIINLANEIQKNNKLNFKKEMIPFIENKFLKPKIYNFKNLSQEINFIVTSIIKDLKNGYKRRQISILCRTNMPLFFLEEKLQKCGIKNKILNTENYLLNSISLSTIHSAKGLEWDKVYLMGMNQSYFPNPKSDIEEERRLFYVAVTRSKQNLIISFNRSDECSSLLLELNEDLFDKDFNFDDLKYNKNELPHEKKLERTVTKIISSLNGENYIKLKELDIFKDIKFSVKSIYEIYEFPAWVKKNDYYSQFGCFVDYLIRRMIADININWNKKYSGLYDKRAHEVITSVFLNKKLYWKWGKYYKGILGCVKLIIQKDKITKKERERIFSQYYKEFDFDDDIKEIISYIITNIKMFKSNIDDINISNKIYLPFDQKNIFVKSYLRYTNPKLTWDKVIYDISLISKCHHVWGDRRKCLYINIKKKDIDELNEFYNDINKFIAELVKDKIVFCNPDLGDGYIYGDADLIIEDELLDIKTSNKKDINVEYTLQLLIYTALAKRKGIKINKISIFNPLLGIYHYADISKWDKDEELMDYLISLH